MALTLRREEETGLARFGSLYLVSAFLVLFGGLLVLDGGEEPFPWGSLAFVCATQGAYQLLLVGALAYLSRVKKRTDEALLLLSLLSAFTFDALFVQHRYGWRDALGMHAALAGAALGLAAVAASAWALGVPLRSRAVVTAGLSVAFIRFGPALVDALQAPGALVPLEARLHAYGALFSLCLLPACLLRESDTLRRPVAVAGVLVPLGFALVHFLSVVSREAPAGAGSLLAPFAILLGPALWRLLPQARSSRAFRWLALCLPLAGLFLAASTTIPTLLETHWARRLPLTPFWMALLLTALLASAAARAGSGALWHVAAAASSLAILGGDLPEVMARIAYPSLWQAPVVALVCYGTIALVPGARAGLLLKTLPAALLDGFFALLGLPRGVGYASASAAGVLLVTRTSRGALPRGLEAALWALVTLPAALAFVADTGSPVRLAVAALLCAGAAAAGRFLKEPLALLSSALAFAVGLLGALVRAQSAAGISAGALLVECGFLLLVVAFLDSLLGRGALPRLRVALLGPAR